MHSEPIRIGIFGASGRLGSAIATCAFADPRFQLAAALVHNQSPHYGVDLGVIMGQKPLGIPLVTDLCEKIDLLIDASTASGLSGRLDLAQKHGLPLVIGTTGLNDADRISIEKAATELPIFYAPNFSIGIALMRTLAAMAARFFPPSAEIDLIETHHTKKKDAPSGSALLLAKTVQESHPRHTAVTTHSLRLREVVGEHTLIFNTAEERLTIAHETHNRNAFAQGALAAAHFLAAQPPGLYGMDDLLAI